MWFYKFSKSKEKDLGFMKEWGDFIINIEYPAGSYRVFKNNQDKEERKMVYYDYGFIWGAKGIDGDSIDVYIGPNKKFKDAYAVKQLKKDGSLDEYKYMIGFDSEKDAKKAYMKHYPKSFFGGIEVIPVDKFKKNIKKSKLSKKIFKHSSTGMIKKSSVTFMLNDSHKISQPQDMLALSFDFSNFCSRNGLYNNEFKSSANNGLVGPDGNDYDKITGTINVYINSGKPKIAQENRALYDQLEAKLEQKREIMFNSEQYSNIPEKQRNILVKETNQLLKQIDSMEDWSPSEEQKKQAENAIAMWIEDKKVLGFVFAVSYEKSKSSKSMVFRVKILKNPTENYSRIPELNLTNRNAYVLLKMLGINSDETSQISLIDIKNKINRIKQDEIEKNKIKSTFEMDQDERTDTNFGAKVIDFGLSEQQIDSYLQKLYELVDFGIKNGFQFIHWG